MCLLGGLSGEPEPGGRPALHGLGLLAKCHLRPRKMPQQVMAQELSRHRDLEEEEKERKLNRGLCVLLPAFLRAKSQEDKR